MEIEKKCPICKSPFIAKRIDTIFCSRACKQADYRINHPDEYEEQKRKNKERQEERKQQELARIAEEKAEQEREFERKTNAMLAEIEFEREKKEAEEQQELARIAAEKAKFEKAKAIAYATAKGKRDAELNYENLYKENIHLKNEIDNLKEQVAKLEKMNHLLSKQQKNIQKDFQTGLLGVTLGKLTENFALKLLEDDK